jgi:hypothetical protein
VCVCVCGGEGGGGWGACNGEVAGLSRSHTLVPLLCSHETGCGEAGMT